MKYLFAACLVLALSACQTAPQQTNVVSAPVRISCASTVPDFPAMQTPCKADAPLDVCFQDYQIDNAQLLGYVGKLLGIIKACN